MSLLRLFRTALVASTLLAMPLATTAQSADKDLVGTWNFTLTSPQGTYPASFDITDQGGKLVGTIVGLPGTSPVAVERTEAGVKMSFTVDYQGQPVPVVMSGKLTGTTLKGSIDYAGGSASGDFEGSKAGATANAATGDATAVTGTWTLSSDGGSGWSMALSQTGTTVTGALKNADRGVNLPLKGTFESGALTLGVDSSEVAGTIKATLEGGMLKGTYNLDGSAGNWSGVRRP